MIVDTKPTKEFYCFGKPDVMLQIIGYAVKIDDRYYSGDADMDLTIVPTKIVPTILSRLETAMKAECKFNPTQSDDFEAYGFGAFDLPDGNTLIAATSSDCSFFTRLISVVHGINNSLRVYEIPHCNRNNAAEVMVAADYLMIQPMFRF